MLDTHFTAVALPTNDGCTWTLVSRLGQMLEEAESLYGPRDRDWTPIGVEFGPGSPRLWYPGNCRNVAIQLAMNAVDNNAVACYQLAHECVHLLAPTGAAKAPVIEEGLATVFSEDYACRVFRLQGPTDWPSYIEAATKVRQLLAIDSQAIKLLRAIEPSFVKMTSATFASAGLDVPATLVSELLAPFIR